MTRMYNPPYPGEVLRDGVFSDAGISVADFAERLGVTRVALSRVLNGKAAISANMALRLAAARNPGCICRPATIFGMRRRCCGVRWRGLRR